MQPNLLLIGAARSGTTALARQLSEHKDVFFIEPKEVHFFAHAALATTYTGPGDDETVNRALISDPDEYLAHFQGSEAYPIRCDGSVSTLYAPQAAIPAILQFAHAEVKLVAVLREPVARAHSSYLYLVGRGYEDAPSFEAGLEREPSRIAAGYQHMWHYRSMSRYAEQLRPFAERFGDRLKVVVFEEFRANPLGHLNDILDFAGVSALETLPVDYDVNRGGIPRSRLLTGAVSLLRQSDSVLAAARAAVPPSIRERVRAANLARPELNSLLVAELASEFAKDVEYVEELLGREVEAWRK